jgi:hypothetical protein
MVGPSATAIDSAKLGMPRLALRDPSIGSITTCVGPPPAMSTWPRSSEIAVSGTASSSSWAKTSSSTARSITSVSSPPSPRPAVAERSPGA